MARVDPPPKPKDHANPAAWQRAAAHLERTCPDFPLAHEVAYRLACHHAARLPLGFETTPIMGVGEPEPHALDREGG
jgi:hypothetical protein